MKEHIFYGGDRLYEFPDIPAGDTVTLTLVRGSIHAIAVEYVKPDNGTTHKSINVSGPFNVLSKCVHGNCAFKGKDCPRVKQGSREPCIISGKPVVFTKMPDMEDI